MKKLWNALNLVWNHPLNCRRKKAALGSWLSWHLRSRLDPNPVVIPFVNDSKLRIKKGMAGATGNIYTGLHEFPEMSFTLQLLRPGDLFIDVGANVGSYTILASSAARAKTISIEPIPRLYEDLIENIRLNQIESLVDARNIGVGDKKEKLIFTSSLETINHVLRENEIGDASSIEVPVETLDSIVGSSCPKLIKVDAEGFETPVIRGADQILSQQTLLAVILELHGAGKFYGYDEEEIHRKIIGYGFKTYAYLPFERRLIVKDGIHQAPYSTLYIRNISQVEKILRSSPRFLIHGASTEI